MAGKPRGYETAIGVVIVVVLAVVYFLDGGTGAAAGHHVPTSSSSVASAGRAGSSGAGTIGYRQLSPQAQHTVRLIRAGGPFPYSHDGAVFENREGHLPSEPSGYYHEYTVRTPGSPDRGARRIVAGQDGELFYTDDHYRSFKRIEGIP